MNDLILNGKSLLDFGVIVSGGGAYGSPERNYSSKEVLGRSGEIIVDNGFWNPVDMEYDCGIVGGSSIDAARAFIASLGVDEIRIEDSFHPDEYYLGRVIGNIEPKAMVNRKLFSFTLKIRRRPERFLKSGENAYVATDSNPITITNSTNFDAFPTLTFMLTVSMSGSTEIRYMSFVTSINPYSGIYVQWDEDDDDAMVKVDCRDMSAVYVSTTAQPKTGAFAGTVQTINGNIPCFIANTKRTVSNASQSLSIVPNFYTL